MDIRVLEFEKRYLNKIAYDWVLYGPASNIKDCQTWERVDRLKPLADDDKRHERDITGTKKMHMNAVWSFIGPKYEAWKKGNEIPEDGIPLKLWAGVDSGQIAEFAFLGIKTVEDIAAMSEAVITKVMLPRVRQTRDSAVAYLASRSDSAVSAKVTELEAKLDAAMALLEAQTTPKRKRRTKDEMEAA